MPKVEKKNYTHKRTTLNPEYLKNVICKPVPFESCLIHNKSDGKVRIETSPKWYTKLNYNEIDTETGEVLNKLYDTDSHKANNNRKIKRLNQFCDHYEPLYRSKKVSLLFYTLTAADKAKIGIIGLIDILKQRAKRQGIPLSFFWTMEVGFSNDKTGHIHYHLAVAIPRLNIKGKALPDWLKLDNVWGQRTEVEFVRKNVRGYMAKYFSKNSARVVGSRMYGMSKGFFALSDEQLN